MADVALRIASSSERAYGDASEFDVWCAFAGSDLRARSYSGPIAVAVVAGPPINADAAATIGEVTCASTGTVGIVTILGTVATTFDALTGASAGAVQLAGAVATTLGSLTGASTGQVRLAGIVATTLGVMTGASTAAVRLAGAASTTLGTLTGASSGAVRLAGLAATTLDAATGASTGTVRMAVAVATTMGDVASSTAGTVTGIPLGLLPTQATGAVNGFRANGRFRIQRG